MKKHKFRVWDKKRKEWLYDTEHAVSLFGETIILGAFPQRRDGSHVPLSEFNNLVAMQYTGLKDKNKNDMFGKDIYKYYGYEVRNGKQIRPEIICVVDDSTDEKWIESCHKLLCLSPERIEKIGNTTDNPELIKETK